MLARLKFPIAPLVNQMLDRLPQDVWTSEVTTFFDPSIGGGQFVREVERRLLAAGHSRANVRGRVSGLAEDKLALNFATTTLVGKYRIGGLEDLGDMGMQFDVIVGNPPYRDGTMNSSSKLWVKFVSKAFQLVKRNGYAAMVTPASWFAPNDAFDVMTSHDIKYVDLTASRHFSGIGSTFSAWVAQNATPAFTTTFATSKGDVDVNWKGLTFFPSEVTPVTLRLTRKFFFEQHDRLEVTRPRDNDAHDNGMHDTETKQYPYRVFYTNSKSVWSKIPAPNHFVPKVIMSRSGYQTPFFSDDCGTSEHGLAITVKNKAEGKRLVRILSSPLYQGMMNLCKYSGFQLQSVMSQLPALDLGRDWTDEDLYAHFGLTKAEIAYIEANAK
jgi:site-specific DNA-methyltransferase (adenine-specific)